MPWLIIATWSPGWVPGVRQRIAQVRPRPPPDVERRAGRRGAIRSWNASALDFMEQTLWTARELRPRAKWGYYGRPRCYTGFNVASSSPACISSVQQRNDALAPLWRASSALYPSVYIGPNPSTRTSARPASSPARSTRRAGSAPTSGCSSTSSRDTWAVCSTPTMRRVVANAERDRPADRVRRRSRRAPTGSSCGAPAASHRRPLRVDGDLRDSTLGPRTAADRLVGRRAARPSSPSRSRYRLPGSTTRSTARSPSARCSAATRRRIARGCSPTARSSAVAWRLCGATSTRPAGSDQRRDVPPIRPRGPARTCR